MSTIVFLSTYQEGGLFNPVHLETYLDHYRGSHKRLEVSSRSDSPLGRHCSAMNLDIVDGQSNYKLECVYQGSKVFEYGGPYVALYNENPFDVKRDRRIYSSGKLTAFYYKRNYWDKNELDYFYDWLYIGAIYSQNTIMSQLCDYGAFTDQFFNSKRSMSTQAKSCAVLVSLIMLGRLDEAMSSKKDFIRVIKDYK